MRTASESKSRDNGLELDTIDGLEIPAGKPDKPAPQSVRHSHPVPVKTSPDRKYLYASLAAALALLVLAVAFFSKQDLSFHFSPAYNRPMKVMGGL